jgi:hypothetical protein
MGIKYGTDGDKMRPFDDVLNVVVLIIHNISYTAISMPTTHQETKYALPTQRKIPIGRN